MAREKNKKTVLHIGTPGEFKKKKKSILKRMGIDENSKIEIKKEDNLQISKDNFLTLYVNDKEYNMVCPSCLSNSFKKRVFICLTEENIGEEKEAFTFDLSGLSCIECGYFQPEELNGWNMLNSVKKIKKTDIKLSRSFDEYIRAFGLWIKEFTLSKNFVIFLFIVLTFILLFTNPNIRQFSANILGNNISISSDATNK